jgi:hypothetical protein
LKVNIIFKKIKQKNMEDNPPPSTSESEPEKKNSNINPKKNQKKFK